MFNRSPEKYKKRIQRKLKHAMGLFHHNIFEVYPMMYDKSEDLESTRVSKNMSKEEFREGILKKEMDCFRYSSFGKDRAPELISSDDYDTISKRIRKELETATYAFRVPKAYKKKTIQMQFKNKNNDPVTLTAQLKRSMFSYYLKEIQLSDGASITYKNEFFGPRYKLKNDKSYEKINNDNINVYFRINDFRLNNALYFPDPNKVTQKYYEPSYDVWYENSEYEELSKLNIDTYFILLVDGSTSLDGKSGKEKNFQNEVSTAMKILDFINPK